MQGGARLGLTHRTAEEEQPDERGDPIAGREGAVDGVQIAALMGGSADETEPLVDAVHREVAQRGPEPVEPGRRHQR